MSRRDEVLQAAMDLLDEVGLDALTTRRLAERLGVRPGALYRHFESKRALLDAMVGALLDAGPGTLTEDEGWARWLTEMATGLRAAMLMHRDGARLVATTVRADTAAAQKSWRYLLDGMRAAGFDDRTALVVSDTVFAYVNGFAIEEQARDGFPQPPHQRAWRDAGFHAGLNLILTGARDQPRTPPAPTT